MSWRGTTSPRGRDRPLQTTAAYTTGLAPGQAVTVGRKGADNDGIPLIGFTDGQATKITNLYGQKK